MMEYALLDKERADVYKDYLTPEAYDRRNDSSVFFYGASTEDAIVGVAAFAADRESELLSVAVSPKWQKQDIGSELVDGIADLLKQNGAASLEAILYRAEDEDAEEGLGKFLWRCGFNAEEEHLVGCFTLKDVKNSKVLQSVSEKKIPTEIKSLSEANMIHARDFGSSLRKKGVFYGWDSEKINPKLSSVYEDHVKISACVLIAEEENGLSLNFAYVDEEHSNPMILLYLLAHSMQSISSEYRDETEISALTMNDTSAQILEKLIGENLRRDKIVRYAIHFSTAD